MLTHRPPRFSAVAALVVLTLSFAARTGEAAPSGNVLPALVSRAVAKYTANVRGIIGMQRHFSTIINGGPIHHTEVSESGLLLDNGAYVDIQYYRIADDGRTLAANKVAQRNIQTNSDWSAGEIFFKEPYDSRYVADYRFRQIASPALCAAAVAIAFSSTVKDAQHGDGTMCIDRLSARITKLSYVPNTLPPHASSGSVTETSAIVLPGVWYVTRIDEMYGGHAMIIHGNATFTGVMDHFRRFPDVLSAKAALSRDTI